MYRFFTVKLTVFLSVWFFHETCMLNSLFTSSEVLSAGIAKRQPRTRLHSRMIISVGILAWRMVAGNLNAIKGFEGGEIRA